MTDIIWKFIDSYYDDVWDIEKEYIFKFKEPVGNIWFVKGDILYPEHRDDYALIVWMKWLEEINGTNNLKYDPYFSLELFDYYTENTNTKFNIIKDEKSYLEFVERDKNGK